MGSVDDGGQAHSAGQVCEREGCQARLEFSDTTSARDFSMTIEPLSLHISVFSWAGKWNWLPVLTCLYLH